MRCPFCQCANAPDARACGVCGGPLRAAQPVGAAQPVRTAPVVRVPIDREPSLVGRVTPDENCAGMAVISSEEPTLGWALENGALQRWNVADDELTTFPYRRFFRKPGRVCCAAFAPQLGLAATGHECGQVRWFDFEGRELAAPASHVGRALALAWTPTHFYSGGNDGVIWSTPVPNDETFARRYKSRALIEGLGAMTTLAFSRDGDLLAVGRDDGAVQLWRLKAASADETEAPVRLDWTRDAGRSPVRSLAFSPNGYMIVSRNAQGAVRLWAAQTSYELPLAPQARQSQVAPAFAADSRFLAIANAENGVEIADIALEQSLHSLPPLGEKIAHLTFAPDAELLAIASAREIAVWQWGT